MWLPRTVRRDQTVWRRRRGGHQPPSRLPASRSSSIDASAGDGSLRVACDRAGLSAGLQALVECGESSRELAAYTWYSADRPEHSVSDVLGEASAHGRSPGEPG